MWKAQCSQCEHPNAVTFGAATSAETGGPFLTLGGFSITVSGLNVIADNTGFLPTVQNASPTAASLTVNISGALNDSFNGILTDGSDGGPLSLTKTGTGTLTLVAEQHVHRHDDDQRRHAPLRRRRNHNPRYRSPARPL